MFVAALGFLFFQLFPAPLGGEKGIWLLFQAIGQLTAMGLSIYWWRQWNASELPQKRDTAREGGVSVWRVSVTLTVAVQTFGLCLIHPAPFLLIG